jgi:hypothetical protein
VTVPAPDPLKLTVNSTWAGGGGVCEFELDVPPQPDHHIIPLQTNPKAHFLNEPIATVSFELRYPLQVVPKRIPLSEALWFISREFAPTMRCV